MKRSFVLTATVVLFVLALVFSSPYSSGTVKADQPDPCLKCLRKLQHDVEKCYDQYGETSLICADVFNNGIIECYATVCEQ